jgi:hypothetical protein
MRTFTILSTLTVVATIAGGAVAGTTISSLHASAAATAEVYYACPNGYAFSTSGSDAAHCKKPAYTEQRSLGGCPIGFPTFRADRLDKKDMCAGTNPVTGEVLVEPACKIEDLSAGSTKRIVTGRDYCGKLIPQQIQPPNRAVSR